jgi:2-keto-3-deoxy-L-rhamnonate aldolase RhmA
MKLTTLRVPLLVIANLILATPSQAQVLELWKQGKVAFGVYAPNENAPVRPPGGGPGGAGGAGGAGRGAAGERPPMPPPLYTVEGGEKLAMNPLYDYVFLNLEGAYDPAAVTAMSKGLHSSKAVSRKTLIVRIPPIEKDGADATKARVKEIFAAGADGVTIPHIRNLDEAKLALSFFKDAKANVWSPSNPKGDKIAMLMLEDPKAIEQRKAIADLKGVSVLACGIGSLAQALGGDRAGAEAGTQQVLVETQRVKLANMLTANAKDVETRVKEGFLALLMNGPGADEAIKIGRAAAGR